MWGNRKISQIFLLVATFIIFFVNVFVWLFPGKDQDVGEVLVKSLQNTKYSIDEKLEKSFINLFSQKPNTSSETLNDAKDTDEQSGAGIKNDGFGDEHIDDVLDDLEYFEQDEDVKNDEIIASGSCGSDEDDLKEHVEFNNGRLRRKAVLGNNIDSSDLKVWGLGLASFIEPLT